MATPRRPKKAGAFSFMPQVSPTLFLLIAVIMPALSLVAAAAMISAAIIRAACILGTDIKGGQRSVVDVFAAAHTKAMQSAADRLANATDRVATTFERCAPNVGAAGIGNKIVLLAEEHRSLSEGTGAMAEAVASAIGAGSIRVAEAIRPIIIKEAKKKK